MPVVRWVLRESVQQAVTFAKVVMFANSVLLSVKARQVCSPLLCKSASGTYLKLTKALTTSVPRVVIGKGTAINGQAALGLDQGLIIIW